VNENFRVYHYIESEYFRDVPEALEMIHTLIIGRLYSRLYNVCLRFSFTQRKSSYVEE
jgi:hypothetical protein